MESMANGPHVNTVLGIFKQPRRKEQSAYTLPLSGSPERENKRLCVKVPLETRFPEVDNVM